MFLFIMMILGLLAIIFWEWIKNTPAIGLAVVIIIVAGLCVIVLLISYPASLDTIANMEAFRDKNYAIYAKTAKLYPDTAKITTGDNQTTIKTISLEITELVSVYNNNLTWYRKYQNHFFMAGFISKISDKLSYITVEND